VDLSFKDILKRSLSGEPLLDRKELEEWEQRRRALAAADQDSSRKDGDDDHKKGKAKTAGKKAGSKKGRWVDNGGSDHEEENGETEPMDEDDDDDVEEEVAAATTFRPPVVEKPTAAEKAKAVERAAILAPQLNMQQIEAAIAKGGAYDKDMINDLMAQTYAASVRWPKDKVLHMRLKHIVSSIEEGRWPVPPHSLLLEQTGDSGTATPEPGANGNHAAARDTSTPLSEVSSRRSFGSVIRLFILTRIRIRLIILMWIQIPPSIHYGTGA
jgi:hypothetical protein